MIESQLDQDSGKKNANKDNPDVVLSVLVITYNHEPYIAKALDSILAQNTKFGFVVKVFDDCSSDKTGEIIRSYSEKYPEKIKAFISEANLGAKANIIKAFLEIEGKYFCVLEGDDYWCDNDKIELQLEALENNDTLIGCGHNTNLMRNGAISEEPILKPDQYKTGQLFNILDVIEGRFYSHTSAIIYRKPAPEILAKFLKIKNVTVKLGDFFTLMFFAQYGNLFYIDRVMSVYRINSNGIWSKLDELKQREMNIEMNLVYKKFLDKKYSPVIDGSSYYGIKDFINLIKSSHLGYLKLIKYTALLYSIKPPKRHFYFFSELRKSLCSGLYKILISLGV
jgi:glycosyltransferase involved in cell wall biosynthesis